MTPTTIRSVADILARLGPRLRPDPDEARERVQARARVARERRLGWYRAHTVERVG